MARGRHRQAVPDDAAAVPDGEPAGQKCGPHLPGHRVHVEGAGPVAG